MYAVIWIYKQTPIAVELHVIFQNIGQTRVCQSQFLRICLATYPIFSGKYVLEVHFIHALLVYQAVIPLHTWNMRTLAPESCGSGWRGIDSQEIMWNTITYPCHASGAKSSYIRKEVGFGDLLTNCFMGKDIIYMISAVTLIIMVLSGHTFARTTSAQLPRLLQTIDSPGSLFTSEEPHAFSIFTLWAHKSFDICPVSLNLKMT